MKKQNIDHNRGNLWRCWKKQGHVSRQKTLTILLPESIFYLGIDTEKNWTYFCNFVHHEQRFGFPCARNQPLPATEGGWAWQPKLIYVRLRARYTSWLLFFQKFLRGTKMLCEHDIFKIFHKTKGMAQVSWHDKWLKSKDNHALSNQFSIWKKVQQIPAACQ